MEKYDGEFKREAVRKVFDGQSVALVVDHPTNLRRMCKKGIGKIPLNY